MIMRPPPLDAPRDTARSRGFTLMEVLVVIVIIGVIVSAATISFGVLGGDREVEDETRRFWALLQQAREEAELQSVDIGVYIAASSYEFLRLDQRKNLWVPITGDALYMPRELPDGLRFRAWLEAREIILKPRLPDRDEKDEEDEEDAEKARLLQSPSANPNGRQDNPPQILVLSNGDIMPFELQIERDSAEALWRVVSLPDNDLRIERRNRDRSWALVRQTNAPEEDDRNRERRRG